MWAFYEYISPKYNIIGLIIGFNKKIIRVMILFNIFQVSGCIFKISSD